MVENGLLKMVEIGPNKGAKMPPKMEPKLSRVLNMVYFVVFFGKNSCELEANEIVGATSYSV